MRRLFRRIFSSLLALYIIAAVDDGFKIGGGALVFLYAAALLTAINIFIKPILKILFLPINMITLGVLSWMVNLIVFYILTRIVPQINIEGWHFVGFKDEILTLPEFTLSANMNFIFVSFVLSVLERIFHWLFD